MSFFLMVPGNNKFYRFFVYGNLWPIFYSTGSFTQKLFVNKQNTLGTMTFKMDRNARIEETKHFLPPLCLLCTSEKVKMI